MGLFKNLKLKSEHVKRVGGFARAVENGLSEKEAWDYVNRIYPPSPELVEYEAKVLGVSRWGSEPQSDPSIEEEEPEPRTDEEEEPEPRTDKEESEPRTEEEVRMFLAATHLAVESSAEDLAAIDSYLSWVLDSLDDWKFCLKSAVINLVLVRTMSDQAQHGEAVKALDSDLDRLDPNLKGAFQNFLGLYRGWNQEEEDLSMEEIVLVTGSWVLWNTAGQTKLSGEEVRAAKKVGMYCVSLSTTWRGVPAEDDELLAMWEAMLP